MSAGSDVPAADIRLRVFGRLDLEADGGDADRVLAQPRRLALFLYLVLRRPGGFVGRDHLLGLFWPESPADQARASLRQALRFLRQCLGSGRIPGRGDEVGVELAGLTCDALEFRRALNAGDPDAALSLYEGDLLPGFFMPDAPDAQRWLETERSHLRTEARRAALELSKAEAAAESADVDEAARHARRALELEPTHEPAARQLIRMLDAKGDRAGAIAVYEELLNTLEGVLDLEPSTETKELVERVRRDRGSAPDEDSAMAVTAGTSADARAGTDAANASNRVVVRPFENLTGDAALDVLGRMAVDWVSRGLSEIPELDVVPPSGTADVFTDAGTIVDGRYYREDSALLLHARLTDVTNDRLLPGPEPVTVAANEPLAGLEEITRRIAAVLAPALNPRATHVYHGARPPNFDVYRAYMEGLEAFIAGDWAEAAQRLGRCAEAAPDYALPRIVRTIATWNLGRLYDAAEIASEAAALRDTVGRFERSVLDTVRTWLKGDWAAAQEAVRVQAGMAPGSIPAFQVAEEARRLNRLHEARDVLLSLDPERGEMRGWIHYWTELAAVLHLLGNHEAELEAATRARRIHRDDPRAFCLEINALAGLGRIEHLERRVEESLALTGDRHPRPGRWLHDTARELWAHGHEAAAARMLDRALGWFREHVDAGADAAMRRDFGRALYDAEKWEAAEKVFRRLVEQAAPGDVQAITGHHGHLRGHLDEGCLAAIAWHRGDEAETDRWRRCLREMDRRFLYGADRLWLGVLKLLDGDEAGAVSEIRRALSEGLPFGLHLHTDPNLAPLRANPRFRALVRRARAELKGRSLPQKVEKHGRHRLGAGEDRLFVGHVGGRMWHADPATVGVRDSQKIHDPGRQLLK